MPTKSRKVIIYIFIEHYYVDVKEMLVINHIVMDHIQL